MAKGRDHRIRQALLKAGAECLDQSDDVGALTASAVAAAAKLKKKDFSACFEDLPSYRRALLLHLFDETRVEVLQAGKSEPRPGHDRVWKCVEAYLDGNLRRRAMRTLVFALARDPVATEMVRRRTNGYGAVLKLELEAMAIPYAAARARFCAVMSQEAAAAEHEAGKLVPDIRAALRAFIRSL